MPDLRSAITDQDHIQGEPEAPLTLLEYGDFQCPHCLLAHKIVKRLTTHFGPRLRFVYRNFPLMEIHPMAEPAAEAPSSPPPLTPRDTGPCTTPSSPTSPASALSSSPPKPASSPWIHPKP